MSIFTDRVIVSAMRIKNQLDTRDQNMWQQANYIGLELKAHCCSHHTMGSSPYLLD